MPNHGVTYRIYGSSGLYGVLVSGLSGSFTKTEKVFEIKSQSVAVSHYSSYQDLEIRSVKGGELLLRFQHSEKCMVAIKGLGLIETIMNRERSIAGLQSKQILGAAAPVWRDSDKGKGVLCRIYVRHDLTEELRDLLIVTLAIFNDRSLWHSIAAAR